MVETTTLTVGALRKILADTTLSDETPIVIENLQDDRSDALVHDVLEAKVHRFRYASPGPLHAELRLHARIGEHLTDPEPDEWFPADPYA